MGEGSSAGGGAGVVVEGSSVVGGSVSVTVGGIGSLVVGGGVSVIGGGDDVVGSLGVEGGFSAAGGAVSSVILLGELLLVLLDGNASRGGSRIACGAADSFVDGGAVLDVGRDVAGTGAGPALADRLVAISRSLSPAHGILEPAAATPSCALLSAVSPSAPISATTCLTTTSRGWPMTSIGWLMGLSESGASQERSEITTTAAATTPAPASVYQRPALPRRPRRLIRAARRRTGVFEPRSSSFSSLRTSCFSACFRMSSAP
jgi:hypothetical protein